MVSSQHCCLYRYPIATDPRKREKFEEGGGLSKAAKGVIEEAVPTIYISTNYCKIFFFK